MTQLAGLPYVELVFDSKGRRQGAGSITPPGVTDLIVISHGWHQAGRDAKVMYADLMQNVKSVASTHPATAGRTFGVAGVYWPSDKFSEDLTLETLPPSTGPAVSVVARDIDGDDVRARAREIALLLDRDPDSFEALAVQAGYGGKAADDLVTALRGALTPSPDEDISEEHGALLGRKKGSQLLIEMKAAMDAHSQAAAVPAAGGPAKPAVRLLSGIRARIVELLNQAAYYELKSRAGLVGQGLGKLLDGDGLAGVERLHLIGHSFGARLVTSAAQEMNILKPHSLTLLQAAFSHNSFGVGVGVGRKKIDGGFRSVVSAGKVSGPIAISHTWNDRATGVAYALASAAGNQIANFLKTTDSFGGAGDIHGALGANGALKLEAGEGDHKDFDGQAVPVLAAGKVSSRHCAFIPDHGGITAVETARLVVGAMS